MDSFFDDKNIEDWLKRIIDARNDAVAYDTIPGNIDKFASLKRDFINQCQQQSAKMYLQGKREARQEYEYVDDYENNYGK